MANKISELNDADPLTGNEWVWVEQGGNPRRVTVDNLVEGINFGSAAFENVGTSGNALGKLTTGNTWSGQQTFSRLTDYSIAHNGNAGFTQILAPDSTNNGDTAAAITFHRSGKSAVHFGLDTDNKLKVGGWSWGTNAYEIFHAGNVASDSEMWSGTVGRAVSASRLYTANAPVTSSGSGTWTPSLKSGRVLMRTLTGTSTLGNPSDVVAGQSGLLIIKQDGTGGRTLDYASNWKIPVGDPPEIDDSPGARNLFSYYVESATEILLDYKGVYG